MTEKKQRGAPRGNQNARKHGFYSQVLDEAQTLQLDEARAVEGIDEEIAILRVKLLTLISQHPDRIDVQMAAANTITRMVRTRHSLTANQKKSLKDAMTRVLTEIRAIAPSVVTDYSSNKLELCNVITYNSVNGRSSE